MSPVQFPAAYPTTNNYIGRSQSGGDPYFNGKIADFRIYQGALNAGQVYSLATGQAPSAPAPAPATFTVVPQPGGTIVLNWSPVAGATSYTVWYSTTSGGPYSEAASLLSGTSYTVSGLTAGTTYYFKVDAANDDGDGTYSTQSSAVALPPLPSAPAGLIAAAASSSSISLVWTAPSNAVTYNVERSPVTGGPYTTIATGVTSTSYINTGLTDGTTYYYVVAGVNAAGEGPNSNEVNAAPSDLLAQLKFNETSGTTAWDATGHGWNGSTMNAPAWTTGKLGNALNLVSGSSQYVTLPAGVVSGLGNFTVCAWVNLASVADWMRILDFGTGTTDYMEITPENGTTGTVRFAITASGVSNEQQINTSATFPIGIWTHVAVTLSGSVGTLYINGTSAGANSAMSLTPSSLGTTTQNYIGQSQSSGDPYLNGLVEDYRIYTRALSASEVASVASTPLAQPAIRSSRAGRPADHGRLEPGAQRHKLHLEFQHC